MVLLPLGAKIQLLVQVLIVSRTENIVGSLLPLLTKELRFFVCELEFPLRYFVGLFNQ